MSDLRYYGFKMEVENESGVKKIVEFRRAVSDVDDTVDKLNETLGDNVTVTAIKTQGDKEALAQARLFVTQQERQNTKTKQVIEQYTKLNSTIETYGNDLETVTAITRLGSNATDEQRREVAALVKQYQTLRNSGDATRGSMRNLRGTFQNLGWQLQDTVVQAQMGTNAFVILSQQGSQVLSSFGAWGALAGAGVAIFGAVMPTVISYFTDAATSAKELEAAQTLVNASLNSTAYTVSGVSKELKELYDVNKDLAQLSLFSAFTNAQTAVQGYTSEIKTALGDTLEDLSRGQERLDALTTGTGAYNRGARIMAARTREVSEELGITGSQAKALARSYSEFVKSGDTKPLTNQLVLLSKSTSNLTPEFAKIVARYVELSSKGELAKAQLKELNELMNGGKSITSSYNQTIETTAEKYRIMTEQLKMNDAQIAVDNYLRGEGKKATEEQQREVAVLIAQYYNEKKAIEDREAARKKAVEDQRKRDADTVKQVKKIQDSLTGSNDPAAQGVIAKEQAFHDERIRVLEDAKQRELDSTIDYDALIEAEHNRHTNAIDDAYLTVAQNSVSYLNQTAGFLSDIVDGIAGGTEKIKDATAEMNDAQKAVFFLSQSIAAASALINGVSLGMKMADLTLNPTWVTVGASLGAASAGVIMGTTFEGMFDKGGYIPQGKKGIVSEYSDELVNGVMVKGPARVTSSEETAKIMSGVGSGQQSTSVKTTLNVEVENNIPNGNYTVSQVDESTVRIIATQVFNDSIDNGVSTVLSTKNSKSDRALRTSYNATRTF